MLTITSIYGPEKKSFETIIYNKNYVEELAPGSPAELRSSSEVSHTSGFDERSLDSAILSPFRVKEASVELDSILITETPLPDLEDITGRAFPEQDKEEDYATDCDEENDLEEEMLDHGDGTEGSRKNSFLLVKKLILPEVQYKWHRGFRRDTNGRYIKVTVLKLQIKYEDAGGLVPWEIHIYFIAEEGEESDTYKVVPVSDNSASVEFTVSNEEHIQMRLYCKERSGQDHLTAPVVTIKPEPTSAVTLGEWHAVSPLVK